MLDHELREALPIDEDDLVLDGAGVGDGVGGEVAGGDEDAFLGVLACEGADEVLDLLAADGGLPALGLDVDDVEEGGFSEAHRETNHA